MRLSSDSLFHYKHSKDIFKLILKNGFRHNMWPESHPYKNSIQNNFIVCFCDILPGQASYHRLCYGDFSIGLSKEWGIKNGVTPVRYVHQNSCGTDAEYIEFKSRVRVIAENTKFDPATMAVDIMISCLAEPIAGNFGFPVSGLLESGSMIFKKECGKWEELVHNELELKSNGEIFKRSIIVHFEKLNMLLRELEKRDSLLRIYQDNFQHPVSGDHKNKILYDEREWRSVRYVSNIDEKSDPGLAKRSFDSKYLPENYNLKFSHSDIDEIRVATFEEAKEIDTFIKNEPTLASGIDHNKIKIW